MAKPKNEPRSDSSKSGPIPVDLVVVMDTSDSMMDEAAKLITALETVVEAVEASCPNNLRVWWFGLEGTWPETIFERSYRDYLNELGIADAAIVGRARGSLPHQGAQEEGAAAIIDIAHHFDWRPGAERLIFYLGDEALKGGIPQTRADVVAADRAIATANANSVMVYTYLGTKVASVGETEQSTIRNEYLRVASATGGQFYESPLANVYLFRDHLAEIVCTGGGYNDIVFPKVKPCFALCWGDGPKDHIETDDRETICIVASNPYSNVIFKDLTIVLSVLSFESGEVPTLPDGTPSVYIKPSRSICFGDLGPCNPRKSRYFPSVSREVTLVSRGAAIGKYTLSIDYSYAEKLLIYGVEQFDLDFVSS